MEIRHYLPLDFGDEFMFESYKPSVNQIREELIFEGE